MHITVHTDANSFLDLTRGPLTERESANGLLLGVALRLTQGRYQPQPAPYMATVEGDSRLVLAALMTPPHGMLLFSPEGVDFVSAMPMVCDNLRQSGIPVPGVLAPSALAAAFAECWAGHPSASSTQVATQWVYGLRQVDRAALRAPGRFRFAEESDLETLVGWFGEGSRNGLLSKIAAQHIGLWVDPGAVSVAAQTRFTGTGGAINRVYTPPEERNRGYSTACVASLCQHLLDTGWGFCCLHADQANVAANRVYRKIGFAPVCAYEEYRFRDEASQVRG